MNAKAAVLLSCSLWHTHIYKVESDRGLAILTSLLLSTLHRWGFELSGNIFYNLLQNSTKAVEFRTEEEGQFDNIRAALWGCMCMWCRWWISLGFLWTEAPTKHTHLYAFTFFAILLSSTQKAVKYLRPPRWVYSIWTAPNTTTMIGRLTGYLVCLFFGSGKPCLFARLDPFFLFTPRLNPFILEFHVQTRHRND